jgi:hypothetical protein
LSSNVLEAYLAAVPNAPENCEIVLNGDYVDVKWDIPSDEGSAILQYLIMVQTSDSTTFELEMTGCEGSDTVTIANGECSIPKYNLLNSPHNLLWGDELFIKVIARTAVGNSLDSNTASSAYLLRLPDAPLNF